MSLPAKLIRQTIVAGLKAENTRAAARVFGNRTRPVWKDQMPVVLVFTREEKAEVFTNTPRVYRRTLSISVVCVDVDQGAPDDLVDDRLDDLAGQVERFFFRDPRLGYGADDAAVQVEGSTLESVDLVTFENEGRPADRPLGGQRLTFAVSYLQEAFEGETTDLEPFHGADMVWTLTPGDSLPDARDVVHLPGS